MLPFKQQVFDQKLWHGEPIEAIHAELTDKCNSGCPMCPRYINNGAELNPHLAKTEVDYESFKKWFPPKFVRGLRKFLACGNYGDPIVAKDTLKIYQYLRETNPLMGLSINTNGSLRTKEWWSELGKVLKFGRQGDYCTFSIDGLKDTNHLYRRFTNFDKIIENAKAFIKSGGVAHWDFIVFDYNEHQVGEARQMAIDLGFTNFNVKRTTRWHIYQNNRGEFSVRNKKYETEYVLRQPLDQTFKDDTYEVLRRNLDQVNYVTEYDFDKMESDSLLHDAPDRMGDYQKIKYNNIDVQCRAVRPEGNCVNEIFLSATGHVFPCCYLGGEPWRYVYEGGKSKDNFMKMLDLNGGMDSIDLRQHSLPEILSTPIYDSMLRRSFAKGHSMRSRQCSTCCGKTWNKLDYGEMGNKQAGYIKDAKT